jgi:hypothetical protein
MRFLFIIGFLAFLPRIFKGIIYALGFSVCLSLIAISLTISRITNFFKRD